MRPTRSLDTLHKTIASAAAGLAAVAVTLTAAPAAQAQIAYALRANAATLGTNLISFNVASPNTLLSDFSLSGATSFIDAIDFRVTNGVLYGYAAPNGGQTPGSVFTINTATGFTTLLSGTANTGPTSTNLLGMDFNPTTGGGLATQFRIVSEAGENLVYTVTAPGAPTVATPLQYAAGDPGAASGQPLGVVDNAYTNNLVGAATTQQYGIDYRTDSLVTIANNAGTLSTVGGVLGNLGVTINKAGGYVGFDIFSSLPAGGGLTNNTAYALLDTTPGAGIAGSTPNLYTINLATGAASLVGRVGGTSGPGQIYSLAVTPQSAAPEPGSLALLAGSVFPFAVVALRRRHRSS